MPWVVRRVDKSTHLIYHYPVDSIGCFANTYPLDSGIHPLNKQGLYFILTTRLAGFEDFGTVFCFLALVAPLGLAVFEELTFIPFFFL